MDNDFSTILYIIFGVVYVLFQAFNKKKKKQRQQEAAQPTEYQPEADTPTKQPPVSFEDLLKELTGDGASEKKVEPTFEEFKPQEENYQHPFSNPEPVIQETKLEPILQPVPHIERTPIGGLKEKRRSEAYQIDDEEKRSEFAEMLASSDGLRKAFVLKEVLDRKYF